MGFLDVLCCLGCTECVMLDVARRSQWIRSADVDVLSSNQEAELDYDDDNVAGVFVNRRGIK